MKRISFIILLLFTATVVAGRCFAQEVKTSYRESSARHVEPQQRIFTAPVIADIEVLGSERIEYSYKVPYVFTPEMVDFIPGFKRTAFLEAAKQYKADIIVGTLFDIQTDETGEVLTIKVIGYPARYTRFRNASKDDLWMLTFYEHSEANNSSIFMAPNQLNIDLVNKENEQHINKK